MADKTNNIQPYVPQFEEVRLMIDTHKYQAYRTINYENILTNWQVGHYVSDKLKTAQWGSGIVTKLAAYLKMKQPDLKGYDRRAFYRMVKFYEMYSSTAFVGILPPQLQLPENKQNLIVGMVSPQLEDSTKILSLLTLINWSSHIEILSTSKTPEECMFYILLCYNENLSLRQLERQIEAGIYERSLLGNNNSSQILKKTYPEASNLFKDSYMVDFLNLPSIHSEKSLQKGLVEQMKKFILDLGKDFLFIGNEYRVQVGISDFKIDLLFFHRGLQCLVAIELKTTKFKPEYIGQLDFYLEALDRDVKKENENPSIGILLCKSTDSEVVEYALSRSLSPTMIAEYKRQLIPKEILQKHLSEYYNNIASLTEDE